MTESRTLISVRGVGLHYRDHRRSLFRGRRTGTWALRDVSIDLQRGELLGVVGDNGAGKSTLLRVLAGIIRPDAGTLHNAGVRATLFSVGVGFLPQLTGRENTLLSGMLLGKRHREVTSLLPQIAEFAQLGERFDEPIEIYSAGMRSRLGFAVAIHVAPDVVLLDEVFATGDRKFQRKSAEALQSAIQAGRTGVLVSHQLDLVRSLCTRTIWLEAGRCREIGPSEAVLERYVAQSS